jgi:predicted MFS family arabinose efflux permease
LARWLALNRTVGVVLLTLLFFGLGEQLWGQFMPAYLEAQVKERAREASAAGGVSWSALWLVGVYACLRNLFEGFCYIGGGQLTARLGDRGSLLLFGVLTVGGYLLFLAAANPWIVVLAALLIMGWEPLSVPVTFTTVGSTVSASQRGMAFALQSIQKRLPKILGPLIAGFVIGHFQRSTADPEVGWTVGMRVLIVAALALGLVSIAIQLRWMPHHKPPPPGPPALTILRNFHPALRTLLVAEVFTRWCDWLVREFVVLYVLLVRGVSPDFFGILIAVQHVTALLTYLPIGRATRTVGLEPFVGLTFIFFALFPLSLAVVPQDWIALAFVVYGLREIGEPARKALITSLLPEGVRARGVGLYWGVRSFALCTASLIGAVLWYWLGPEWLLYSAFALGVVGVGIYYLFGRSALLTEVPSPAATHAP